MTREGNHHDLIQGHISPWTKCLVYGMVLFSHATQLGTIRSYRYQVDQESS
jgi:hypothetical protein